MVVLILHHPCQAESSNQNIFLFQMGSSLSFCCLPTQDKAHLVERRTRQEDLCLTRARSVDLATAPCQYGRARWLLVGGLLVSLCFTLLGSLGVAPFAAPLRSVARHFNRTSAGELSRTKLGSCHSTLSSCHDG